MNANNLLNAISGIDPQYIDEAAYELRAIESTGTTGTVNGTERIVNIDRKRRIRKLIYVALPSVAAILLILGVAVPAILRISHSDSAATAEAPAAPAAMEEAAPSDSYDAASEAPAAMEESEPVAESTDESIALGIDSENKTKRDTDAYNLTNGTQASAEAASETAEESAKEAEDVMPSPVATYKDGILTIETAELLHMDLEGETYRIFNTDDTDSSSPVAEGDLIDLTKQREVTDDPLVLDLTSLKLDPGDYRIDMKIGTAEFTVP